MHCVNKETHPKISKGKSMNSQYILYLKFDTTLLIKKPVFLMHVIHILH